MTTIPHKWLGRHLQPIAPTLAILALLAIAQPAQCADVPQKPNIILILSDDVGLGDVHCCGGPFKTPHLDALASGGTRFERCYSTPLCGPSRCQLLTGRYPFRTGLVNNHSHDAVDPTREVMIPTVMKKAGYATASVGKWGQIRLGPGEWGFEEYLVFSGSGRYWRDQAKSYVVNGTAVDLPEGKYLPEVMHQFAVDFIDRNKNRPFFLYYPMSHIHGPIVRTPNSKPGADKDRLYADNVEYMDLLVGKLMDELDRQHLREKTVVMFTGDNGTARFGVEKATVDGRSISGMKGSMLEGGSRVPLLVNWPGTTPAGKVNHDLVDFSDFLVTCAELGGAELPKDVTLDGRSFASQIRGQQGHPRDWVYVELNGRSFVRDARFKLTNGGELFDLTEAPFKEIAVPADSSNAAATAARKSLQAVLDDHRAAAGSEDPKKQKKQGAKKQGEKKRAGQKKKAAKANVT